MAKEKNIAPADKEKLEREKAYKEREKAEKKALEKKRKEKLKKEKAKQKRLKAKEKKELNKIKEKINFPYKMLFNISFLVTMLSFITIFYGWNYEIYDALFYSFFIFIIMYMTIGIIMIVIFYFISEAKIKEAIEKQKAEEEKRKEEEQKLAAEHAALEENLREEFLKQQKLISDNKNKKLNAQFENEIKDKTQLQEETINNGRLNAEDEFENFTSNEILNNEGEQPLIDESFINEILTEEERKNLENNKYIK